MFIECYCSYRKKLVIFILTVIFGVSGCKPSIDHLTVTYGKGGVETYYFDPDSDETNIAEIKSHQSITIELISSDQQPQHIKKHKISWRVKEGDVGEWIINGIEEKDEGFWIDLEGNTITLRGPQNITDEITLEVTVTCIESQESPTTLQFTVRSTAQLAELNKKIFAAAESIKKYIFLEQQAVEAKTKSHIYQRSIIHSATKDYFYKEEANIEDAQKKLDYAQKLLARLHENPEFLSQVSNSILSSNYFTDCVEALRANHGFFTEEGNSSYSQKLCLNNISDLSHRDGRRRNLVSSSQLVTNCFKFDATLVILPEAAMGVTPFCFLMGAAIPIQYYLASSREQEHEQEQEHYPYIYKQRFVTRIFYSPILSYIIQNNSHHENEFRLLKDIQREKCPNKNIPCVIEVTDSDDRDIMDDLRQILDRFAISDPSNVHKDELLTYTQPITPTPVITKLHDSEYLVTVDSDMLQLENNEFETIYWTEKAPDKYYLRAPRRFNENFLVRVPLNDDQKEIFRYIKTKATASDTQTIEGFKDLIQCGGRNLSTQNCDLFYSFGDVPASLIPSSTTLEQNIFGYKESGEELIIVDAGSFNHQKEEKNKYCRKLLLKDQKISEALMIGAQGEDKTVGCFTVTVENTERFELNRMENVIGYFIDCDLNDKTRIVIDGRRCVGLTKKTRVTVFLVFNENNAITSYSNLFKNNKSIKEFYELPPFGSQGKLQESFEVSDYTSMFENSGLEFLALNPMMASQNVSMRSMFKEALDFNGGNIRYWDTQKINDMSNMFNSAKKFNYEINTWNVSNVTSMAGMFEGAELFNQMLAGWQVGNVQTMESMFRKATKFNRRISNWDVSNVLDMSNMFSDAAKFRRKLNNWNVTNVLNMSNMFRGAANFNRSLSRWDVEGVKNLSNIFRDAAKFSQDISSWIISEMVDYDERYRTNMFLGSAMQEMYEFQPRERTELID